VDQFILKRYLKIIVSTCFFAALASRHAIDRLLGARRPHRMAILYHHSVPRDRATSFARQMRFLSRHTRVVAADWHSNPPDKELRDERHWLPVIFDHPFESVPKNALPVLIELCRSVRYRHVFTMWGSIRAMGHSSSS
jgi:hypothetical protein